MKVGGDFFPNIWKRNWSVYPGSLPFIRHAKMLAVEGELKQGWVKQNIPEVCL